MPHFSQCCGRDEYVCQVCGEVYCSQCSPSQWRTDITQSTSAGNVCPDCCAAHDAPVRKTSVKITKSDRKTFIRHMLNTDSRWATKALVDIYNRQTADEKASDSTTHLNAVGFTGPDAELLSSFARQYIARGTLSSKQMALLFRKIHKYCAQILSLCSMDKLDLQIEKYFTQQ